MIRSTLRGVPALRPLQEHRTEPLDARLRDDAALDEIELTSRLMIAASQSQVPLARAEVDALLGVAAGDDAMNGSQARSDRESSNSHTDV